MSMSISIEGSGISAHTSSNSLFIGSALPFSLFHASINYIQVYFHFLMADMSKSVNMKAAILCAKGTKTLLLAFYFLNALISLDRSLSYDEL